MKTKILLLVLLLASFSNYSQSDSFWSKYSGEVSKLTTDKNVSRSSFPKTYELFELNIDAMRSVLLASVNKSGTSQTIISLPNANGQIEQFEVFEASNFDNELQARFPEIRAFSGKGISDKYATLKISISPKGIQTMVFRADKENEFIENFSANGKIYAVYNSQREKGKLAWTCSTPEKQLVNDLDFKISNITSKANDTNLRTMRLAQSCTAEYSNYFGATSAAQVSLVLAAYNATLTRCNGVYEKDLALHLYLVNNSTNVIYYDPTTDPYDDGAAGSGGTWNAQLQTTLTNLIGEANYDVGHLFGASGGGGNAGCIGCVCVDGSKGRGFTSPGSGGPVGDNFDIDYVVHEIGHQLGGTHTFSNANEGTGTNMEVGSGITIMGYAGITSANIASHSIDTYHAVSISQIQVNLVTKSCPIVTNISANNSTPVAVAGLNYNIPISTPFVLTGSGTDANPNNVLTYSWEQYDNSPSTLSDAASLASAAKLAGPNWISNNPSSSGIRYFPKLSRILLNQTRSEERRVGKEC